MTSSLVARRHDGVWRVAVVSPAEPGQDDSVEAARMALTLPPPRLASAAPDDLPWTLEFAKAAFGPGGIALGFAQLLADRCSESSGDECRVHGPLRWLSVRAANAALRRQGVDVASSSLNATFDRARLVAACCVALVALLGSVLRSRSGQKQLPKAAEFLFAVHGEWSNRTRHLLSLLTQGAAPGAILVLGRPRQPLAELRAEWRAKLGVPLPPLVRPYSAGAWVSSLGRCLTATLAGARVAARTPYLPDWRETVAISYRVILGEVSATWWTKQSCAVQTVFFGHTGLADTSLLELSQQASGTATVHEVHGLSGGLNFMGISTLARFRCGHDADWHKRLGGYGRCESPMAPMPAPAAGASGVLLVTNLAHPMNPAGPQSGVAAEIGVLERVAAAAAALGAEGPLAWKPHPSLPGIPSAITDPLVERAQALGYQRVPDAAPLARECRKAQLVVCTTSTVVVDLMLQGRMPLMLVDATLVPDSALARYPLQCSAGQERSGMQRALALGETGADTFRSAWNDIRPAAPLTVDDLRQRSG